MSPTARIPSEILIEIFQISCQPVYNGYRQAVTPFFIGSICRRWRDVAWSTPLLWNTILLHVSLKQHSSQVQLLRDWLLNARSAPLSIKLIAEHEHGPVLCHAIEAIMRILVTRSDYWLTFDSCLPSQCHNIFKNINFPMLTSVSLVSTSIIPDMFLTAPKLVDFNLPHYNFSMMLPWEQIRCFKTQWLTVPMCLKIIRQSPNLQECHFEQVDSRFSLTSKTITSHAQLKILYVMLRGTGASSESMSLFDSVTLPSLSNLRIQYKGTKRLPLSSITSLFLRSASILERFTIEFPFDNADLIPCLEAIPSLTYLHLERLWAQSSDMGLTGDLVASLDPLSNLNSSRLLLPNLKYFKYKGPALCDCRTIVDMLAHRWHLPNDGGASQSIRASKLQLAEVFSTVPYHVTADVQEELRNLLEEGMLVRIESLVRD